MTRIEKLSAANIKNLELADVPFSEVTLVLGENGCGKSNLLQLIHVLLQTKVMPPEITKPAAFPLEGYVDDPDMLRRGHASATASLTLLGQGKNYKALCKEFLVKEDDKSRLATIDFAIKEHKPGILVEVAAIRIGKKAIFPPPKGASYTAEQQAALEKWIRDEVAGKSTYIPNARLLKRNLVPYQVKRPDSAVEDLENTILRFFTSKGEDAAALERIRLTLGTFFDIEDVRPQLVPPEIKEPVKGPDGKLPPPPPPPAASDIGVGIRVREGKDTWFELDHVGSGIQQVLAIVTMLEESKATIALIEEFETSLSHKNRNRLLHKLGELVGTGKPLAQVITSSHAIFEPRQPTVLSIGPTKPNVRQNVNFHEWDKPDWKLHTTIKPGKDD